MPAMQGILNKSSNGVSPTEQVAAPQPSRPPKPQTRSRRTIPHFRLPPGFRKLTRWGNKQSLSGSKKAGETDGRAGGVRFADEEEPKTEDSFDYKDIDFATEIFDFRAPAHSTTNRMRTPPPVPPSPSMRAAKGSPALLRAPTTPDDLPSKKVAFSEITPVDSDENHHQQADEVSDDQAETQPSISIDEDSAESPLVDESGTSKALTPEEKLTQFLRDHEGQELSEDDIVQLEKLLNETDDAEHEQEVTKESTNASPIETQTHFDENQMEDEEADAESHIPRIVEEVSLQLEEEPRGHTDFSVIEFNKAEHTQESRPVKAVRIVDEGFYEPVGEPPANKQQGRIFQKPPDMSGFVPPKASVNVGDPFSWRRRGMRRWDRYGYEKFQNGSYIPATMQIVEGCRQVENYIISRQLSPPGYLLDVLGTHRKLKRRKKKKKKAVPIISVVHQLPSVQFSSPAEPVSFEDRVTSIILQESFEELKNNLVNADQESSIQACDVNPSESSVVVEKEVLVVKSSPPENKIETPSNLSETNEIAFIDDDVSPHSKPDGLLEKVSETVEVGRPTRVSRKDTLKKERPPRPLPPTPLPIQDFKPTRPSRRVKRVSSAEPPSTSFTTETTLTAVSSFQSQTFPRSKAPSRRSISAEEVQRRIQLQAQQFFRTPRKKELQEMAANSRKKTAVVNRNSSLKLYDTLRHRPRSSRLTPVYTPINKTCPRKKDFASQTGSEVDDDRESVPPPPPPKMRHLLMSREEKINDDVSFGSHPDIDRIEEQIQTAPALESAFSTVPKEFDQLQPEPQDSHTTELEKELQNPPSDLSRPPPPSDNISSNLLNYENMPFMKMASSDGQLPIALFCGFLPAGRNLPSNLTEIPEMTVHRLTVDHLEAAFIKVAQVEAGRFLVQSLENLNQSLSSPVVDAPIANTADEERAEETLLPEVLSQFKEEVDLMESPAVDVNGNDDFASSERPLSWDDNSSWTGRMIPSSSSASYVTCDETLHGSSIADSEFGTDVEDEFGPDDEVSAGGLTPTPLDLELEVEREDDYDLLRQVFAAAVANGNNNNNNVLQ